MTQTLFSIAPSGTADMLARMIGEKLSGTLEQPLISDLPKVAESGLPGFEVVGWYGVLAPAGTPPAIVRRLNADIVKVLGMPDIKKRIAGQGAEVVGNTPAQFDAFLKADIARWAPVIKASGAKVE